MPPCVACGHDAPDGSTFCPTCGTRLDVESASQPASSSVRLVDRGTFAAGRVIAGRYRIVGLVGRGGMGEVYEADDLTLGQVVALKFLPSSLDRDDEALRHLLDEVRIARRVAHGNVARVYDIARADDRHFLTMEFVRGEDLGQLLRRIGRLPPEKGLEIAHQICAGLAASHDEGVLHRDLKPANVLLDTEGKVRLTDFGLAVLAQDQEDGVAGTPAYMAPEQIRGHTMTVRSEVYSLGLLLFELVTGQRAFTAKTFDEFARLHETQAPPTPSGVVDNLDPQVERVILQCLEKDPMRRPPTARAVSAALPGGDLLAAALAAGQTPAPEVVAAAGSGELWRPATVVAFAVVGVLLAAIAMALGARADRFTVIGLPKPPEVLVERTQDLLQSVGYHDGAADTGFWFTQDTRRDTVGFVYRQSPDVLAFQGARLSTSDPAPTTPGMVEVYLAPDGALRSLAVVPEPAAAEPNPTAEYDWAPLLAATGLDRATLTPAEPAMPRVFADRWHAWSVAQAGDPPAVARIEAAALRGRPVVFGDRTGLDEFRETSIQAPLTTLVFQLLAVLIPLASALLAWRNVRLGRGDRRGALRISLLTFALVWAGTMLRGDHFSGWDGLAREFRTTGLAVFSAVLIWIGYLAFEPYVRRRWPHALIPWTRLLARRGNDPLVGRDLLIGVAVGAGLMCLVNLVRLLPAWLGSGPVALVERKYDAFLLRQALGHLLEMPFYALCAAMLCVLTIALARRVFGRAGLVAWVFVVSVFLWAFLPDNTDLTIRAVYLLILSTALATVLVRYGLLALVVLVLASLLVTRIPLTLNPTSWYFRNALLAGLCVLALTGWGLRAALAGRPLFREEV